ncbi:MAG: acyltransferase [Opitutaceae bacterium]|jgi:acetyltransferase-like isoleucine patch superfamily enzyme
MELINEDSPRRSLVNVRVGSNVRLFNFINAYGCEIGDNSRIGSFVEIQKNARIGRNCKVSSHTFICEGVDIGDEVFIGHNVSFINDKFPRAVRPDGALQTDADWTVQPTQVKKGASIGTGATILCGIVIGERAVVGAGSVVTRDVAPGSVVAGSPARPLRTLPQK